MVYKPNSKTRHPITLSSFGPRSLYDTTYGTLSPPSMNLLYTLGAAASMENVEFEQSCHSHFHSYFFLSSKYSNNVHNLNRLTKLLYLEPEQLAAVYKESEESNTKN